MSFEFSCLCDGFRWPQLLTLACARGQIRFVKETRKQHKVAEIHSNGQFNVDWWNVTGWTTASSQVVMRPNIYRTPNNHLGELQWRNYHWDGTRWLKAHCTKRIIRVHYWVYEIVHDNEPASGRGIFGVREPSVNQHGDVMVPVQKDERLLPQHNEQRVAKLGQLRKHKQPRPEATNAILLDVTGKKKLRSDI